MDDRTKAVIDELRAEVKRLKERIESLEQENRQLREELEKAQQQMARQAAPFRREELAVEWSRRIIHCKPLTASSNTRIYL